MNLVVDTCCVISVISNEPTKEKIIETTAGFNLQAPGSLLWELGNALTAILKKKRVSVKELIKAYQVFQKIPIRYHEVDMELSLQLSERFQLYAYDAYFMACCLNLNCSMITMDHQLIQTAKVLGIHVIEV